MKMSNKLYVVLRFENQHDQFGGYFHGIFTSLSAAKSPNGYFGRKDSEYTWYQVHEIWSDKEYVEGSYVHEYESSKEVNEFL